MNLYEICKSLYICMSHKLSNRIFMIDIVSQILLFHLNLSYSTFTCFIYLFLAYSQSNGIIFDTFYLIWLSYTSVITCMPQFDLKLSLHVVCFQDTYVYFLAIMTIKYIVSSDVRKTQTQNTLPLQKKSSTIIYSGHSFDYLQATNRKTV